MELDHLVSLLDSGDEVSAACRRAVMDGGRWRVSSTRVPASELAWIYAVRERQLQEAGTATLGFAAAVEALWSAGQQVLRLDYVLNAGRPSYHFQLFLDASLTAVVACLGVEQAWPAASPWNPKHHPLGEAHSEGE